MKRCINVDNFSPFVEKNKRLTTKLSFFNEFISKLTKKPTKTSFYTQLSTEKACGKVVNIYGCGEVIHRKTTFFKG